MLSLTCVRSRPLEKPQCGPVRLPSQTVSGQPSAGRLLVYHYAYTPCLKIEFCVVHLSYPCSGTLPPSHEGAGYLPYFCWTPPGPWYIALRSYGYTPGLGFVRDIKPRAFPRSQDAGSKLKTQLNRVPSYNLALHTLLITLIQCDSLGLYNRRLG